MIKKFLVSLAFLVLAPTIYAEVDTSKFIKDDDRLQEMFSGMTFDGYHHKKDYEFHRYFAADGKMYGSNPNRGNVNGTWWISSGQLCFEWSHKPKTKCRYVSSSSDQVMIYKHRKKKSDYKLKLSLLNRRPGNPLKFE